MARPDRNREVWEGWTVGALADDLYALARMINDGNAIKKGILNERIRYSWLGITDGALDNGTENLSSIRSRVAPYVIPIPTDRVMSSNGVLSNDGYAIRNK